MNKQIRVIMPGFEHTSTKMPFHPFFLKNIEHYSVLRFMNWQDINSNTEAQWANRTTPAMATKHSAPLEDMIALCNQVGAHPWFNIPHLATDDYVRNFAMMVKASLRPDLKVCLQYSELSQNRRFQTSRL